MSLKEKIDSWKGKRNNEMDNLLRLMQCQVSRGPMGICLGNGDMIGYRQAFNNMVETIRKRSYSTTVAALAESRYRKNSSILRKLKDGIVDYLER